MERNLNALHVYLISAILLGAFAIQIFMDETPCSLCFLQRLCMIGVATGALMNCRFGPRKLHYGLSLLSSVLGGAIALRQIVLHICPDFPVFGKPFWGLSLYTWSFLIFASSVAYIGLMLIIFDQSKDLEDAMNAWCHFAFFTAFGIAVANIVVSFVICGWGTC
jgi:disulfide bond formation protein DsbB